MPLDFVRQISIDYELKVLVRAVDFRLSTGCDTAER